MYSHADRPSTHTSSSTPLLLINLNLLRILLNLGMNSIFNQLAPAPRNLQYQIVERRAAQDIHMIGYQPR